MDFAGAFAWDNVVFILKGLLVTLEVALISIVLSFVIGCILAIVQYAKIPVLSHIVATWVEIIRNLPLLLLIMFTYIALPDIGIKLDPFVSTVVALTVFESAMLAEIVRGGLRSIEKGQIEAARSSGLTYVQTLWHIVLPQALRSMVPPTVSQFISLLKDTSLATAIALPELVHNMSIVKSQNVNYTLPAFLLATMLYLIVNFALSIVSRRLELRRA
ncbi:glutamine ABC transporter permease [Gordoniibacillus kamchatkensis]|uniref:Glutamine ABC transporter permease n=1 Tax=Gordoniibacillus kamchatkensis TaxID=1590651 RepID=A0ABR5AIB3_9BACL|nr:amino acid ABC transporter permease [Paenibacillus sp. VKM B-2647]KIL40771.1 glutamine ABC transporter permease [Paenibacillus sp. VKM B-2647]